MVTGIMSQEKRINNFRIIFGIIFFISGVSGLIYQVAWQRLLTLYYGVGHISTTIIVSVFMFGLGIGALIGGKISDRIKNQLNFYFLIELLVGIFGILSINFLEFIGKSTAGANYHLMFIYAFIFLSIPTFLMGTTLPLICKIFSYLSPDFYENISFLYFINTLGAAIGAIFCSYILISIWGIKSAIFFAAGLNLSLAICVLMIIYTKKPSFFKTGLINKNSYKFSINNSHLIIFIVGFLALGYEIVWFRITSIITKASPYAFSSTLSVYLLGISLGSYLMNKYIKKKNYLTNKSTFYMFQAIIAFYVLISMLIFYYGIKYSALNNLAYTSFNIELHPAFSLQIIAKNIHRGSSSDSTLFFMKFYQNLDCFIWPIFFLFIPTFFMGASFPLINTLAYQGKDEVASSVGGLYFSNVLGNLFGGLITGFILLPLLKTTGTLILFIIIGISFVLLINSKDKIIYLENVFKYRRLRFLIVLVIIIVTFLAFPSNHDLYATMHFPTKDTRVYVEEGMDSVIVTFHKPGRIFNYINGLGHGYYPGPAYVARTIAYLSHAKKAKDILIIGFGTGNSAEAVSKLDNNPNITLIEISNDLINNLKKINKLKHILNNPKIQFIIDDGRRYLLRTDKKFDVIFMDPLRTTTMYSNNIYSKEFFSLVKSHLKKGGLFGLYNDGNMDILPNTLHKEFKHINVYKGHMFGSDEELNFNEKRYNQLTGSYAPGYSTQIINKRIDLLYNETAMKDKLTTTQYNTDYTPWLEYRLGIKIRELLKK